MLDGRGARDTATLSTVSDYPGLELSPTLDFWMRPQLNGDKLAGLGRRSDDCSRGDSGSTEAG
jgi:hypothetical protein